MDTKQTKTIDKYISTFPKNVQDILQKLRRVIKEAAPEATEAISYGMPTFKLNGKNLVHFAAWQNHIGLYGAPSEAVETLKKGLAPYKTSKGTIQFPLDEPMPYALIGKIVKLRIKENLAKKKRY